MDGLPPFAAAPLGSMLFYKVPEGGYETAKVRRLFSKHGFDTGLLPQPEAAANSFRRMCTDTNQRRWNVVGAEDQVPLLAKVRLVEDKRNRKEFQYVIRRDLFLPTGALAASQQIGWARFIYPNPRHPKVLVQIEMTYVDARPEERPHIDELKRWMEDTFATYRQEMDSAKLRNLLRNLLHRRLHAVQTHDSMYFIPQERLGALEGVKDILAQLGCHPWVLPVLDCEESRDAVEAFATHDLTVLMQRVQADAENLLARRRRGVTEKAYAGVKVVFDEVQATTVAYVLLLDRTLNQVGDAAEHAKEVLEKIRTDLPGAV